MNWNEAEPSQWVNDVSVRNIDHINILTWQWPRNIQYVYIAKVIEQEADIERSGRPLKLYTREEYKANAGYKDSVTSIGKIVYKVYPAIRKDGQMIVLDQQNQLNEVSPKTQKGKIFYSITYKKNWFSQQKTVRIKVRTEISLPKETLSYVKKTGSSPLNIDDGSVYSFVHDFDQGLSLLPDIQINKQDYIGLFFTNGKKDGEHYELIPE